VLPGLLCLLALPADARGPLRIKHERGVVYGKLEGIGLTMDVFTPLQGSNGKGLICVVSGSFFSSREILDQFSWVFESASRNYGYTIFAVMHAGLPRFSIGQIVPQITRSVRYVRAHAGQYGIDPERLGMMAFPRGATFR
jgi:acetyl esterase/lipase